MKLDDAALAKATRAFTPKNYARVFPAAHRATPLGTGPGKARFSSKAGNFTTLYAARSLATAIAETVIRDRFEGGGARLLFSTEITGFCLVSISATAPLQLLDLRTDGCFQLGVSTDIASAKGYNDSCILAQYMYDYTALDGFLYHSRLTKQNCIAIFDRAIATRLVAGRPRDLLATSHLPEALSILNTKLLA